MITSVIEPVTFLLVTQCFNQIRNSMKPIFCVIAIFVGMKIFKFIIPVLFYVNKGG